MSTNIDIQLEKKKHGLSSFKGIQARPTSVTAYEAPVCFSPLRTEFMMSDPVILSHPIGQESRLSEGETNESFLSRLGLLKIMRSDLMNSALWREKQVMKSAVTRNEVTPSQFMPPSWMPGILYFNYS